MIGQDIKYTINLAHGIPVITLNTPLAQGDDRAQKFIFELMNGEDKADASNLACTAYFVRGEGQEDSDTISLGGEFSDNVLTIELKSGCYTKQTYFVLSVRLIDQNTGIKRTIVFVRGVVRTTQDGGSGDPDESLPSVEEILALMDDVEKAIERANEAAERAENAAGSGGSGGGLPTGGSGNVIPSYWLTHLNERIPAIRAAMTAAGWKKSAFLWYHDVHWTYGYKKAPMLLKYLYEHTPINKTMFGGDVVDNEGDTSTMAYLWDWRDAVRDIPNHHSVPGNHDDGNTTDNLWDDPYIYAYLLAAEETPDVVRTDAGLYYYIDDPTEKTRYLYIDTATKDGNIINDTAEQAWLVESLKSTPAGWHIVAIAHIWRTVDYDVSPPADAGWSYGGAYCIGEFDKYNARTGEYASCTGKVEFCIGGHTHVDADFVSDGGIPVILTECDSRYVRSSLECTEGTITESSVNAIVADYANGIVNVIRIGRGSSRTVNLDGSGSSGGETPDVPDVPTGDFTNVLTEAGFSEGMRFSNSSLTDVEAAGWDITGYIPATRGDVIRMANVNFIDLDGTGGTSRAMIYLFDADKTYITCSANYDPNNLMSDAWSAVYGDDGDVVQFTIPTSYSSTVAYIRIGARNIDQYSVITVNEVIESTVAMLDQAVLDNTVLA